MSVLDEQQRQRALESMQEYFAAPPMPEGRTPVEEEEELDEKRAALIEKELKPLVRSFLDGTTPLATFKSTVDGSNKHNQFWGFKGIKGQMFFNMVVNVADNPNECEQELKAAIALPISEQIASSRIKTFTSYVKRLGEQWVDAGNTRYGAPKAGSIPFFLSYFWQIQDRDTWPIYYTNGVNTMTDLNLWQPSGELAEDYLAYKRIHEELAKLFAEEADRPIHLYDVEHIFWFKGGNPYETAKTPAEAGGYARSDTDARITLVDEHIKRLPDSYIPPIVGILPHIARHKAGLDEAAKRSATTLDRAFEKYIDAAFRMLGYETKLLGQGKGRVPDGVALALNDSYAILWDAKIRTNGYSMGTDDRTIREYVTTQSRELKRRWSLRNIYYAIVSSTFVDDFDDTIHSIKMETNVSEVTLIEAEALVGMVNAKLRSPLQITLGPDGMQRLFVSGILSADIVREQLV